ncbi:MAG: ELM1/GtrOC1 family putative glycosyltransferase [Campylobacteraceae bacterium]
MKILIISDGRAGHENQSIAFCELLDAKFDILHVSFKNKVLKTLSYFLDWLNIYIKIFICKEETKKDYDFIVCAGSTTYYGAKYFSKHLHVKSIALMYPKGYKNNFFRIFAQSHDNPKEAKNLTILPINISNPKPKNIYTPKKDAVGIIIGGNNSAFSMQKEDIKNYLQKIEEEFKYCEIAISTSPRTPKDVDDLIENTSFDYRVIYSKDKTNPTTDFINSCKYVFITEDSTSMISDAVSAGSANVEILKLKTQKKDSKFKRFIDNLISLNTVHIYDGTISNKNTKIDLRKVIKGEIL